MLTQKRIIVSVVLLSVVLIICYNSSSRGEAFSNFGQFYGGILGTIVAIVGISYIIRTYEIQQQQFDVVKKDADFNIISQLYDSLIIEINSIQFRRVTHVEQVYNGIDAIFNFESLHQPPNSVMNHLQSIFISFEQILYLTEDRLKFKYSEQKKIMLTKIYFLYYEKIVWSVYERIYREEKKNMTNHPGIEEFYQKFEELTIRSYEFLLKNKYVGMPSEQEILKLVKHLDTQHQSD